MSTMNKLPKQTKVDYYRVSKLALSHQAEKTKVCKGSVVPCTLYNVKLCIKLYLEIHQYSIQWGKIIYMYTAI